MKFRLDCKGKINCNIEKKYLLSIVFLFLCLFQALNIKADNDESFFQSQNYLIENKIKPAGITNPFIINALRQIPRHLFLPPEVSALAYENIPLPFRQGFFDPAPLSSAKIIDSLQLKDTDSVLVVGVGSGYIAALLSRVVNEVKVTDLNQVLLKRAQEIFNRLNLTNIQLSLRDGIEGWNQARLFDAIVINGSLNYLPESLISFLQVEGRLIIPFDKGSGVQNLLLLQRKEKDYQLKSLGDVIFPPLETQLIKAKKTITIN